MTCGACEAAARAARMDPELEGHLPSYQPTGATESCNCTGTAIMWGVGGFILGCLATVAFVNISGETSIMGLGKKTVEYGRRTVDVGKRTFGKR